LREVVSGFSQPNAYFTISPSPLPPFPHHTHPHAQCVYRSSWRGKNRHSKSWPLKKWRWKRSRRAFLLQLCANSPFWREWKYDIYIYIHIYVYIYTYIYIPISALRELPIFTESTTYIYIYMYIYMYMHICTLININIQTCIYRYL